MTEEINGSISQCVSIENAVKNALTGSKFDIKKIEILSIKYGKTKWIVNFPYSEYLSFNRNFKSLNFPLVFGYLLLTEDNRYDELEKNLRTNISDKFIGDLKIGQGMVRF